MTESHDQGQMPGGRSSQGPVTEVKSDGPQVDVPPYESRTTEFDEARAARSGKAFDASNAPEPGPEPPVSEAERTGTSPTDINPEPALGVGESTGRRAEDIAPDRSDTETAEAGRSRGQAADDDAF